MKNRNKYTYCQKWFIFLSDSLGHNAKSTHMDTDMPHIVVRFEQANKQAKPRMDSESRG